MWAYRTIEPEIKVYYPAREIAHSSVRLFVHSLARMLGEGSDKNSKPLIPSATFSLPSLILLCLSLSLSISITPSSLGNIQSKGHRIVT